MSIDMIIYTYSITLLSFIPLLCPFISHIHIVLHYIIFHTSAMSIYMIIYTYSITLHSLIPLLCPFILSYIHIVLHHIFSYLYHVYCVLQSVAVCCSVLQCVDCGTMIEWAGASATHCNRCSGSLYHGATVNTLQHTATHCNTLQHTATHCNTLSYLYHVYLYYYILLYIIIYTYIQIVLHNTLFHTTIVSIYIITCTESVTLHSFIPLLWFIKETYIHGKRPIHTERDQQKRKEICKWDLHLREKQ